MKFIAHKRILDDGSIERQTLMDHSRQTAAYAGACLEKVGMKKTGYLAGLLHDMGKYKKKFQLYLEEGDQSKRGSVNHTFAGCRYLLDTFHGDTADAFERLTAEILAYAVGAHHGQFDCVNIDDESGFDYRIEKKEIQYEESCKNFLLHCSDEEELSTLFSQATHEVSVLFEKLNQMGVENDDRSGNEVGFYLGLLVRLVLSAVVEGDRRDTAEFMDDAHFECKDMCSSDGWKSHLNFMESKLAMFSQDTAIQCARMNISDQCCKAAEQESGVFRLNVPTGGGKTLSGLRFALAHAEKWKKERIIFVTPLLAILEQNAKIVREYIGDNSIILEHHSNVIEDETTKKETLDLRELAIENWGKPVIITTMVQLLNTMFKGKMSNIRRFHSLSNAVIVIDEVQTVPTHMLSMFNMTVNFLSETCQTTFLLCSATQPCFEKADHPMLPRIVDVVPYQKELWQAFERTVIKDAGPKRLDQIPDFVRSRISQSRSLLIICNKKSQAAYLYNELQHDADEIYHLSASMCMAHRQVVLEKIYSTLKDPAKKIICVSTQVIEAGVDISFGCVIRLMAGMDHIVQSAGRCNRNGESNDIVPVYVVDCTDERLNKLKEIQRGKDACRALLNAYKNNSTESKENLASDASIIWYYRKLYDTMRVDDKNWQDYIIPDQHDSMFSLLSINQKHCGEYAGRYFINQSFKMAGILFEVFDENTRDVVVPYGEGIKLIQEIEDERYPTVVKLKEWSRRAKEFSVSVYNYQLQQLKHCLREVSGILILSKEAYDDKLGVHISDELTFLEV